MTKEGCEKRGGWKDRGFFATMNKRCALKTYEWGARNNPGKNKGKQGSGARIPRRCMWIALRPRGKTKENTLNSMGGTSNRKLALTEAVGAVNQKGKKADKRGDMGNS